MWSEERRKDDASIEGERTRDKWGKITRQTESERCCEGDKEKGTKVKKQKWIREKGLERRWKEESNQKEYCRVEDG